MNNETISVDRKKLWFQSNFMLVVIIIVAEWESIAAWKLEISYAMKLLFRLIIYASPIDRLYFGSRFKLWLGSGGFRSKKASSNSSSHMDHIDLCGISRVFAAHRPVALFWQWWNYIRSKFKWANLLKTVESSKMQQNCNSVPKTNI